MTSSRNASASSERRRTGRQGNVIRQISSKPGYPSWGDGSRRSQTRARRTPSTHRARCSHALGLVDGADELTVNAAALAAVFPPGTDVAQTAALAARTQPVGLTDGVAATTTPGGGAGEEPCQVMAADQNALEEAEGGNGSRAT